jgi:hypothetical protein
MTGSMGRGTCVLGLTTFASSKRVDGSSGVVSISASSQEGLRAERRRQSSAAKITATRTNSGIRTSDVIGTRLVYGNNRSKGLFDFCPLFLALVGLMTNPKKG